MASRHGEMEKYRSSNLISSDDETDILFPAGSSRKKTIVLESSDESESENELERIPFHSTLISGISEDQHSLSTNSISDLDVFVSDDETKQNNVKPRKSVRISLALGKLLDSKTHLSSDGGESENEHTVKENYQEKTWQCSKQKDESGVLRENKSVQLHNDSVQYISSKDSESEHESAAKVSMVLSERRNENGKLHKKSVQLQNDLEIPCISDDSDIEGNEMRNCENQKENVLPVDCKTENLGHSKSENIAIGSSKFNKENDITEVQRINVENKPNKLKISDIRTYGQIQKPQITQSRDQLKKEIDVLAKDIAKLKNTIRCIDTSHLPDNGIKIQMKLQEFTHLLKIKERELKKLPADLIDECVIVKTVEHVKSRLPVGLGVKALQTQIREKTLTEEALSDLHGSISTCPSENVLADAPLGLKSSVELMPHQRHALAWLIWRETQKPPAGILADDMGLGKTLTMISLVLKAKQEVDNKIDNICEDIEGDLPGYPVGGTLVVCPASLLLQWEDEIKKHCRRGVLNVEIHHGSHREENPRKLSQNDIVITTYSIVRTSANKAGKGDSIEISKRGVLHRIRWNRIILDEAHVVRNYKSQQSHAVFLLMGSKRWALTGTPIHNKELDLYALLKFLRCSPFDDYNVWRRWVDNKNDAGIKRLNTVINAIMLRRTKAILQEKGDLASLPEKTLKEIFVQLEKSEFDVYTKILWFSKTLFSQFLQQRADKEMGLPVFSKPSFTPNHDENKIAFSNHPELAKLFNRMQQMRDIKTHEILVLLLRLRQVCVHPGLIRAMLNEEQKETVGTEDLDGLDSDIVSKMGAISLENPSHTHSESDETETILSVSNPVFDLTRTSSKMKAVLQVLEEKVLNTSDKGIIVSQWTQTLNMVHDYLNGFGVTCEILSGDVPVKDRMEVVNRFNRDGGCRVLLLSLTAGGVGLNLTGGNHLFLIDLHWNPQLESQAFDRIYRVGQKKPVYIYKFICKDTIEERIKHLQEKKLSLATGVLSGTIKRNVSKLTLDDLKGLFSM